MPLNMKRLSRAQQASSSTGGGFMKLTPGKNTVRVFSFTNTVKNSDFLKGLYRKSDGVKIGEKYDEIERRVEKHFLEEGVVNCIGAGCFYCKQADEFKDSTSETDKKMYRKLKASNGFAINAVDVGNNSNEILICNVPAVVVNAIISYVKDPEYGESVLNNRGRDFVIEKDLKATPQNMYNVKIRDEKHCEDITPSNKATNLFDCTVLEPGWSSTESLNEFVPVKKEESENKPVNTNTVKEVEKEQEKEVPFKDDTDTEATLPWETDVKDRVNILNKPKSEWEIKDAVKFDDEGSILTGYIVEIDEGKKEVSVQTGTKEEDIFDGIGFDEITKIEKPNKRRRRK